MNCACTNGNLLYFSLQQLSGSTKVMICPNFGSFSFIIGSWEVLFCEWVQRMPIIQDTGKAALIRQLSNALRRSMYMNVMASFPLGIYKLWPSKLFSVIFLQWKTLSKKKPYINGGSRPISTVGRSAVRLSGSHVQGNLQYVFQFSNHAK